MSRFKRFVMVFAVFALLNGAVVAQLTGLQVMPRNLHFEDKFNRRNVVFVSNMQASPIRIDSLKYDSNLFEVRLNGISGFPVTLQTAESFSLEILLYNYFNLFSNDTSKKIILYNNSSDPIIEIGVKVHMFHEQMHGEIKGFVKDTLGVSLSGAKVYFFYGGTILLDSAVTDIAGKFHKELPVGSYFAAALQDGYYMQFSDKKNSPLEADFITVMMDMESTVNFELEPEAVTDYSVSGIVADADNNAPLAKSVVVIRRGKHTPTKVANTNSEIYRDYSILTSDDGTYHINNIKSSGDYYAQAFASFYSPGFFNEAHSPVSLWQHADSIFIADSLIGLDIYLQRDSSYGAGAAQGEIVVDNGSAPAEDALLYAVSTATNSIYSYNFTNSSGDFSVVNLPVGTYRLVSQKIGYEDAVSSQFSITLDQDTIQNINLTIITTSITAEDISPDGFDLYQNYPNPFNPSTTIEYYLPRSGFVYAAIYDLNGRLVKTLIEGHQNAGKQRLVWNGVNNAGEPVVSAPYFVRVQVFGIVYTKKMMLIK